jgi:hypothetical protein
MQGQGTPAMLPPVSPEATRILILEFVDGITGGKTSDSKMEKIAMSYLWLVRNAITALLNWSGFWSIEK